jgi:hypothetical protein
LQDVQQLARHTFRHFITTLIIALVFLIPDQSPRGVGMPLLALGMLGLLAELRMKRAEAHVGAGRGLATRWRPLNALISYSLLSGVALNILLFHGRSFVWLVYANIGLLVTAALGSWRLLLVLGLWRHTPPDGFDEREREARTQG